ncbi:hypothetical protein TSOC_004094 [Tetrabaena socialis]|uniref:Uncharacterized protein n=1 Tax=Tetrabaena socialis TaxID=47790 RepID=A0A2J8A9U1_9CHLO|nr:hypothetical protein TSOC_004094 [Tetrabaena socialis]|eukprot:PNH09279.1 hypothetical protein TSOC_004094 [Tetrabaena socialis]
MAAWQLPRGRDAASLCCLAVGMVLGFLVAVQLGAAAHGTHIRSSGGLLSVSDSGGGSSSGNGGSGGSLQTGPSDAAAGSAAAAAADVAAAEDAVKRTAAAAAAAAAAATTTAIFQAKSVEEVAAVTVEAIVQGLEADEAAVVSAEAARARGGGGGLGVQGQGHQQQLLHVRRGQEGGERKLRERAAEDGGAAADAAAAAAQADLPKEEAATDAAAAAAQADQPKAEAAADAAAATAAAAAQTEQPKAEAKDGAAEAKAAEPEPAWARKEEGLPPVVVPPLEQFKFDIALSTGYRPQYGATFASCLVGLLASGAMAHASALHLLLSDARLLNFSLIHNLAHMGGAVRVSLYDMQGASTSMRARNVFYQLLRTPDLVPGPIPALAPNATADAAAPAAALGGGGSDLPSVFLEDDVWMVDDFPRKIHAVAAHASRRTGGGPFVIKLYLNTGIYAPPAVIRQRHAEQCNVTATVFPPVPNAAANAGTPADAGAILLTPYAMQAAANIRYTEANSSTNATEAADATDPATDPSLQGYRAKPRSYRWGSQGLYFSDGAVRRRLLACYLQYTERRWERQRRTKDWPLKMCLGAMHVASFDGGRSLLQHIGASSSLFGGADTNAKYHRACSFPFVERLPPQYGATIASCLVGLLASGAMRHASALHLLLSDARLLNFSLIHNLAHMGGAVRFKFDIALSTGYRPQYGATFASCLVSLLASGAMLHASALHLLLSDARLLNFSLIHNLAHMGGAVRVSLYDMQGASTSMRARNVFYQLTPAAAPGFGAAAAAGGEQPGDAKKRSLLAEATAAEGAARAATEAAATPAALAMHTVAAHASRRTGGGPFVIKLYLNTGKYAPPAVIRQRHAEQCNATATVFPPVANTAATAGTPADAGAVLLTPYAMQGASLQGYRAKPRSYRWGAQGLYFSDGALRRRLLACYLQYTERRWERQRRYKDWPLKMCLGAMHVASFDSGRSLVQHIGASSSLFGGADTNAKYHQACSFPFVERLPPQYGATIASCLVGLLASGAMRHASALHLLLSDARLLNFSLIHNLAHMGGAVRVSLYDMQGASTSMRARNVFYQLTPLPHPHCRLLRTPDLVPGPIPAIAPDVAADAAAPAAAPGFGAAAAAGGEQPGDAKKRSLLAEATAAEGAARAATEAAATPAALAYGATFASCLVSLLASGAMLHASALHLLLSDARLLNFSLIHNLAHMGGAVRVSLYDMQGASTSMRARNVFYHGGGSDLPSVFLEDDVWMVDDFPRKMHAVAAHASRRTGGGPFVIKLYLHTGKYAPPAVIRQRHAEQCNAAATVFPPVANTAATAGTPADAGAVLLTPYAMQGASLQGYRAKPRSYRWGAQGLYFSDGALRRRLRACYLQYTERRFDSGRSLVQHIGASSSLFGGADTNAKYHQACSFPFVERLPPQYGATIASCLVGLLASGAMLHASALHLLLSDARLLNFSLIHNLAHMGGAVRVSLYDMQGASTSMRARNVFYQLLRTPDLVPGPIPALGSEAVADAAAAAARLGAGGTTAAGEEQPGDGKKRSLLAAAAEAAAMQGTLDVGGSGGGSDLPSVFLEDDVWMVDDFPRKMHTVAAHASRRTGGGPFVIKLYSNTGRYAAPAVIRQRHAKECNATATVFPPVANAAATAGTPADVGAVLLTPYAMQGASLQGYRAKPRSYRWGAQGLYFSDGALRRRLLACYLQYTGRKWERQNRYKDWPLKMCLGAMHVASFDSGRSLVQHIGASSSLFGDANTNAKYHRACSFPFVERLPSEDLPADWY